MKLETAMIFVKDMERMTRFYRDGLGLTLLAEESAEGWVVLDAGGARLALHAIPAGIAAGIAISDPPEARDDTALKLVFATDELTAACERLEAHGAVMSRPFGDRRCDGLDPEGNVFQVRVQL